MARTTVGAEESVPMSTSAKRGPSFIGADGTRAILKSLCFCFCDILFTWVCKKLITEKELSLDSNRLPCLCVDYEFSASLFRVKFNAC